MAEKSLAQFIRLGWRWIDKADFITNWHIDAICERLEAVSRGELRRLIINIPPRHMKSTGVCVAWPAWTWAQDPEKGEPGSWFGPSTQFLYASYAQNLSTRDSIKCRRLINSPWYQSKWGGRFRFSGDQNAKTRFDNDHMGYRIATSVNGLATGEGGDIIVVDDPHNVRKAESEVVRNGVLDWWDETMSNRLNDPKNGAFVIIMQRVHSLDLTGHILASETGWEHLCLPARFEIDHPNRWPRDPRRADGELLWPARVPMAELDKMESNMGPYAVAGQMQQRPSPREGGMFKREWFDGKRIDEHSIPCGTIWWRHWDLAATEHKVTDTRSARTAGVLMGRTPDGRYIVADLQTLAKQGNAVQVKIKAQALEDGRRVNISLPQDPGQAGKVQKLSFIQLLEGFNIRVTPEIGDKITRAEPFSAQCEGGNVYLVEAPWNDDFLDEVCLFPGGARKDIVDACSGAFARLVPSPLSDMVSVVAGPQVFGRERERPGYEYDDRALF